MVRLSFPAILLLACASVQAGESPADGWPSFAGPGGFTPAPAGLRLVDSGAAVRVAWRHAEHMGVQKTNRTAADQFYGGTATVIVGDGLAFTTWIRPGGTVRDRTSKNRYYDLSQGEPRMGLIDADDVAVAVDAETGAVRWRAEHAGAAMNLLFGKRGHYGVSPAHADGRFFAWGGLGIVTAYAAADGAVLWRTPVEPFHGRAAAAKAKALETRRLVDTYGNDPVFADLRTGLVAAAGVVVAPDGAEGLVALDAATGQVRWTAKGVIARGATPALWRRDGTTWLLCPVGGRTTSTVRLVDAATGAVAWTLDLGGPNHTSLVVGDGDTVLMNTRGNNQTGAKGPQGDAKAGSGLFAGYRISATGATLRWTLPDEEANWHATRPDRGMNRRIAIRGGRAYALLGGVGPGQDGQRLATIDLADGRILARSTDTFGGTACSPVVVEDRLVFANDLCHSWGGVALHLFRIGGDGIPVRLPDAPVHAGLKVDVVTDYEVANEIAWWRGRGITKALDGMVAIDLRAP